MPKNSRAKISKENSSKTKPADARTANKPQHRQRSKSRAKNSHADEMEEDHLVQLPTSPEEFRKVEAAVLGLVRGRRYSGHETPAQRRVSLQTWADHDAYRRTTNTMFLFWTVCPESACRRAKSCVGQPHDCFLRWWPHVPEDFKFGVRMAIKALGEGASGAEAGQVLGEAMQRAREEQAHAVPGVEASVESAPSPASATTTVAPVAPSPPERPLARVRLL
jgi:hypothetical protein